VQEYQKRAFDWIPPSTAYTPGAKEDRACDGRSYQYSIYVADLWESGDAPEEVNRAGED
jgi:hypothetical protein